MGKKHRFAHLIAPEIELIVGLHSGQPVKKHS